MTPHRRPLLLSPLLGLAALGVTKTAEASPRKSNTATDLPRNLQVGDVDGDGFQDLVQFGRNKVFAYKTNFKRDGILHGYLPAEITRLVLGDFTTNGREHGRDQICAVTKAKTLMCYASSDDNRELWWWWTQPNFIEDSEEVIVGDFDGNGADDLLLYKSATGSMRFFTRYAGKKRFQPMKDVDMGNLGDFDRRNKVVLAGDFGQAVGRDDLLFRDKSTGKISRYDSATKNGKTTFWWAFHTRAGFVQKQEVVRSANVEGGNRDGVAVFDPVASEFRFYKAEYAGGNLRTSGTVAGNLAGKRGFTPVFGRFAAWNSEPGTKRDDILLYEHKSSQLLRFDARWDSKAKRRTYWSAYRASAPNYHAGWPAMRKDKIAVAKCKFSDVSNEPRSHTAIKDRFAKSGKGKDGWWDFAWEQSYGMIDTQVTMPTAWKEMDHTRALWKQLPSRWDRISACMTTHNVDTNKFKAVVAYMNANEEVGRGGKGVVLYKGADHSNMLGHEIMHTYGLPHAFSSDGKAYEDGYDIMGGISGPDAHYSYSGPFARTGVGLHAYHRAKVGWLPSNRKLTLRVTSRAQTKTVSLATVDRPEANGMLLAEIRKDDGTRLFVEFREKHGWDKGIPEDTVLIRRIAEHPSPTDHNEVTYLQDAHGGPAYTQGESFARFGITITVKKINHAAGTAEVEIRY